MCCMPYHHLADTQADAFITMITCFFGSPFPTTIYIGQPAFKVLHAVPLASFLLCPKFLLSLPTQTTWLLTPQNRPLFCLKAMGARTGYLLLNAFCIVLIAVFNGAIFALHIFPVASGVGFLLWIGVLVTAQAFSSQR